MNISSQLTDRVRAELLRKGLIVWGAKMRGEVEDTCRMLQQVNNGGELLFMQRPDKLYSLVHTSIAYGYRPLVLGGYTKELLGARMLHGVPCYTDLKDLGRVKRKLVKLGVNALIKVI